jgi:AraC family transcriptional regulator
MPLINPPAANLGRVNAIVAGRARHYEVARFAGPLSLKSVISGVATWETRDGRYEIPASGSLILNDGEEYSMEIASPQPVETFCLFFERGFVEDASRAIENGSAALLDGETSSDAITFSERLHYDHLLNAELMNARAHREDDVALDACFFAVAAHLVRVRAGSRSRMARIPALRSSTRSELMLRLERGVAMIHANLGRRISVTEVASTACLSPFHFHRLFVAAYGETPHRAMTRLRLEHAAALLRGSDRDVAEVAMACGFESVSSFTSLFARRFGAPPRKWSVSQ